MTPGPLFTTPLKLVAFDLDGTLFNSAPGIAQCINAVLEADSRRRLDLAEVTAMIGDGAYVLTERAYSATGGAPTDRGGLDARAKAMIGLLNDIAVTPDDLYPGAMETLQALADAGVTTALCTNKLEGLARHALEGLKISHFFKAVIGGDTLAERKPHPLPLLSILETCSTDPTRAVMIGDSANDLNTARAAGVGCVLVSFGYSRDPIPSLGADLIIDDLGELRKLLS